MEQFARTEALIGKEAMKKLSKCRVVVFGAGGVGSHAIEALVRCGVGTVVIVDGARIDSTNINRQIHATVDTTGRYKVDVMRERLLKINPEATVETHRVFVTAGSAGSYIEPCCDYIADAVDTVSAKISIVETALDMGIRVISSMGAGNKMDPSRFRVADIYQTSVDPLARVMRRELRKRGILSLKVVFSDEKPIANLNPPASISFVPPVAGLVMAGEIVHGLIH